MRENNCPQETIEETSSWEVRTTNAVMQRQYTVTRNAITTPWKPGKPLKNTPNSSPPTDTRATSRKSLLERKRNATTTSTAEIAITTPNPAVENVN